MCATIFGRLKDVECFRRALCPTVLIIAIATPYLATAAPPEIRRKLEVQSERAQSVVRETQERFDPPDALLQKYISYTRFGLMRQERISSLKKHSMSANLPVSYTESKKEVFRILFFGPGIDDNLLTLYKFLLDKNPAYLQPIKINQELVSFYCFGRYDTWLADTDYDTWTSVGWNDETAIEVVTEFQSGGWGGHVGEEFYYGVPKSELMEIHEEFPEIGGGEFDHSRWFGLAKIYYAREYLQRPKFVQIEDPGLRAQLVATSVVHDTKTASKWLQGAVGVTEDGIVGDETIRAVNSADPRIVSRGLIESGIRERGCYLPSAAAHAYGTFTRYIPGEFEAALLARLHSYAGAPALPGLETSVVERAITVRSLDFEEKRGCRRFRFDSQECYLGSIGDWKILAAQGIEVKVLLPKAESDKIVEAYQRQVRKSDSYQNNRIIIDRHVGSAAQSFTELPAEKYGLDFEGLACLGGVGQDKILSILGTKGFDSLDDLKSHIASYRNYFFEGWNQSKTNPERYVEVNLWDRLNGVSRDEFLKHLDFGDQEPTSSVSLCLSNATREWHALFGMGLIAAKRNKLGIVGLLPDLPLDRLVPLEVGNLDDFENRITALVHLNSENRDATPNLVVAIPLDLQAPEEPRFKKLKPLIEFVSRSTLFVVAAGQPDTPGQRGKRLSRDCYDVPMCLGYQSNVITVGAMDRTEQEKLPKLWRESNYGGPVSVIAPGVALLST